MSWFKDGIKDVWDAFLGRDIGNSGSGFGGSGSSRSNTVDQVNLPGSVNTDEPEEIRQLTSSIIDTRDPNSSIPVIYSSSLEFETTSPSGRETGPTLVHISTSGTNNEYLHLTWWVCHGPIQRLEAWDKNFGTDTPNNRLPDSGSLFSWTFDWPSPTQYYQQTVYDGYGTIFVHSGETSNQAKPTWHPDENYYPGIAHIKMTLQLPTSGVVDPPFINLPKLTWFVYGINPDWRLISNNPSSNTKNNKAAYLYDYLINKTYGAGIKPSDLDLGSFVDAYNIESSAINSYIGPDGEPINSQNPEPIHNVLHLSADKSVGENVTQQLAEIQSILTFKRGKFYLKPNDNLMFFSNNWSSGGYRFPSISRFTLTEENCLGGLVFTPSPGEQNTNRYTFKVVNHRRYITTIDNVNFITSRDRIVEYDQTDKDPRVTDSLSPHKSYSGSPSVADVLGAVATHKLKSSVSFKASGEFLNADPYDIVRIDHPNFGSLFWYDFIITDVRLNGDLTVDIQATGSQRFDSSARGLTTDALRVIEQDSDNYLKKYIYDYPESGKQLQFHNQEISEYNENRFSDTYVAGVNIDPDTGNSVAEGTVLSVTALNPQSAIHPYYIHTDTDSVISQRFRVEIQQITSGQHNLYIRAYTKDPVTGNITPVQKGSSNDQFRSVPSNDRMPEITTYQGTGLQPQSGNQTFEFTLTLLENTLYTIRAETYNNTTGDLVNTVDIGDFTTYADASALPVNLFSYRTGTLESAYSGTYSYPGGNLSSVLANCLGGTLTVNYDLYYDQAGSYPRSFTVDIPSTNVADALAKTFFYEYDNRDWIDIDPRPNYDIREVLEFRDSGGTLIHTQSNFTWFFWGNTRLERAANFSQGSLYNLSEAIETALVDAGRTDLLW